MHHRSCAATSCCKRQGQDSSEQRRASTKRYGTSSLLHSPDPCCAYLWHFITCLAQQHCLPGYLHTAPDPGTLHSSHEVAVAFGILASKCANPWSGWVAAMLLRRSTYTPVIEFLVWVIRVCSKPLVFDAGLVRPPALPFLPKVKSSRWASYKDCCSSVPTEIPVTQT